MAWSTRELADLAGSTVKAVRHYHKLGLLDEPERAANGYKQYQVAHLVRLLQITRLADLGVPLARIATMGHADEDPAAALRVLDAELEATIQRLQRIRGEVATILQLGASAELPAGFISAAGDLSAADRSIIMVYSRVLDDAAMDDVQQMVTDEQGSSMDAQLDALPADADRATRRRLAESLAPVISGLVDQYPWLSDPGSRAPRGSAFAEDTVTQALRELYNPAQLEVLYRAHLLTTGSTDAITELDAALDAADAARAAEATGSDNATRGN